MIFNKSDKTAVFIDGSNIHASARALGFDIDYQRLLAWFQANTNLVTARYYTAILEGEEYNAVRPLVDWLAYNGYVVVSKAAKKFTDSNGHQRVKGNMDGELSVDILSMAWSRHLDDVVLISGDGDFRYLVNAVQNMGVRVTVISTIRSAPPMIADELRRQADQFVDLSSIRSDIERKAQKNEYP